MVKVGDIVFVQTKGICEILDIKKDAFFGCDKNKEYYILKPTSITNNMIIYIPLDSKVNMRHLSQKKDCERIFNGLKEFNVVLKSEGESEISTYEYTAKSCDLNKWAELLNTLLLKRSKINKKQFSYQEQKLLNLMLSCVSEELSYVLQKDKNEVISAIENMYV